LTTNFIHTLEAINLFLVLVMLFQVRKHYKLFANPSLKTKHKAAVTKTEIRPALHAFNQTRPAPKYYFHKLPELEVSTSSDQDIASFTNSTSINEPAQTKKATKKPLLRNPISRKKNSKPVQAPRPTHKVILNNYIDDFFTEPAQKEAQENDHFACLDFQINSPANDEIITVNEPSEMV